MPAASTARWAGLLALGLLAAPGLAAPASAQGAAAAPAAQALSIPPNFADLVERVGPAVVRVSTTGLAPVQEAEVPPDLRGSPLEELFRRFGGGRRGGQEPAPQPRQTAGQGSGFIIDAAGFVVTNNHVVGDAVRVTVELADGRELVAQVVGTDPQTDIALLKVDPEGPLPTVTWGNSDGLRVGEPVLAMGNPFGLGGTATSGIVSARGRQIGAGPYDDFIQTDASINPGNSGGPLFNLAGEVVGVNTAIFSPTGGNIGIGFAVPARLARRVVEDLRDDGRVQRGWLGVALQPVDRELAQALGAREARGALVSAVEPGSPAARSGVRVGDLILGANGREVQTPRDLASAIADVAPGTAVPLVLSRDGQRREQPVTVAAAPDRRAEAVQQRQAQRSATGDAGLGMALGPRQGGEGVAITRVQPGSVAAERGLQAGDVILRAGDREVSGPADVGAAIEAARGAGRSAIALQVQRGPARSFVAVPLPRG